MAMAGLPVRLFSSRPRRDVKLRRRHSRDGGADDDVEPEQTRGFVQARLSFNRKMYYQLI
jgi:hypothetical protein